MAEDCEHKEKGRRFFMCNNFEHIAPNYKEKKESDKSSFEAGVNLFSAVDTNDWYKKIVAENIDLEALIDTESALSCCVKIFFKKCVP